MTTVQLFGHRQRHPIHIFRRRWLTRGYQVSQPTLHHIDATLTVLYAWTLTAVAKVCSWTCPQEPKSNNLHRQTCCFVSFEIREHSHSYLKSIQTQVVCSRVTLQCSQSSSCHSNTPNPCPRCTPISPAEPQQILPEPDRSTPAELYRQEDVMQHSDPD